MTYNEQLVAKWLIKDWVESVESMVQTFVYILSTFSFALIPKLTVLLKCFDHVN